MPTAFSKLKYVKPSVLLDFANMLEQTIDQIHTAKTLNIMKDYRPHGPVVIEEWPLVHHVTCGEYLKYTSNTFTNSVSLWIGLDLVEEGVALLIWFDIPDNTVIKNVVAKSNNGCCGDFGRYKRGNIDQAWITLNATLFDQFMNMPTGSPQASQVIEGFLRDVLSGI